MSFLHGENHLQKNSFRMVLLQIFLNILSSENQYFLQFYLSQSGNNWVVPLILTLE